MDRLGSRIYANSGRPAVRAPFRYASLRANGGVHPQNRSKKVQGVGRCCLPTDLAEENIHPTGMGSWSGGAHPLR
jgi:hypothetical protein